MTDHAVEEAKAIHRIAFELIPIGASVALITLGLIRDEISLISFGAAIMGLPGITATAKAIKGQDSHDAS